MKQMSKSVNSDQVSNKIHQPNEYNTSSLLRQAWISLALWIAFGVLLEGLIGFRTPALLDDALRRDMLRLAHAHGTLLNLVLIAAGSVHDSISSASAAWPLWNCAPS